MKLKLTIHEAVIILSALGLLLDVNTSNTSKRLMIWSIKYVI